MPADYSNDAFGRVLLQTNPTAPHAFYKYDNEGRNLATGLFSSTGSITVGTDDPRTETTNRLALTEAFYDEIGQMWKSVRHSIDATDGSDDDSLEHLYWRDAEGRVLKEDGPQLTKTFYDRLGRTTQRFVLISDNDTTYSHVNDVSGDKVAEQYETVYESGDSDDVLMTVLVDRMHNDGKPPTPPSTGALDTNNDGDDLLVTATNLKGRAQITCSWYDRFGRVTDQVQYGDNGGSTFDRDGLSVPSRSDTALVTSYSYDPGQAYTEVTDPRGLVARTEVDDAGRTITVIRNYDSGVNGGLPANSDDNQTVRYEYVDGLRTKIVADMPSGQDDQETVYIYGTTTGTPPSQVISTGHQLRAVKYPDTSNSGTTSANIDSDSSDVVSHAYNAQGQEVYKKDQAGNIFESNYDTSGRRTHLRVATLASGFDGDVRRQSWTYDSLGRASLVTQYDNATVGSGSVTDEVSYAYDGWGGITSYKQDKDSAVGGSGYYEMAYACAKATTGRNTVRRTSMTLPGGLAVTINYASGDDDKMSRVTSLKDGTTTLARYEYLGATRVVGTKYSEANIARNEFDNSSGNYSGFLDNFNRILESAWWTLAPSPDVAFYDCDVSYDRNSNITWVEDKVHSGFDVKYTMDDLDRLVDAEEGTRSGASIASRTRQQTWTTLDHVGNWDASTLDLNGDGYFDDADDLDEIRTHNGVNELLARDVDNDSSDDYTLAYDAAGNMTDDGEHYEYDAFYRLRKVKNQSSTLLAEYRYNGLGHMIGVHEDTDADLDCDASDLWFYPAYDEGWREVARYRESDTSPKEQFVNALAGLDGYGGSSYINDVVCRERDNTNGWLAASDGTLEERYYYCPNWRGDVSALVTSGRQLHEMDKYSAYGIPFGLPGGDADSDGDNDAADYTQIQALIDAPSYDPRGDLDLDGDVDAADKALAEDAPILGITLGRYGLSSSEIRNRRGLGGYEYLIAGNTQSRARSYRTGLGRWLQREPLPYLDSQSLYEYAKSAPYVYDDFDGLQSVSAMAKEPDRIIAAGLTFPHFLALRAIEITADSRWPGRGSNNSMRHCWAACMLVELAGSSRTRMIGVIHEEATDFNDDWLDLMANEEGIRCARRYKPFLLRTLGPAPLSLDQDATCVACCNASYGGMPTGSNGPGGLMPSGPNTPGPGAPGAPGGAPRSISFYPTTPTTPRTPGAGAPGAPGFPPVGIPPLIGPFTGIPTDKTPGAGAGGAPGGAGQGGTGGAGPQGPPKRPTTPGGSELRWPRLPRSPR